MFSISSVFVAESIEFSVGDAEGVAVGAAVAADARTELATSAVLVAMTICRRIDMDFPNCLATQPGFGIVAGRTLLQDGPAESPIVLGHGLCYFPKK
ncbi:hypothetical protein ACFY5D_12500 [Paeniglutamicibacter sp. NPDC012692]|uniref:hypothetical protein n=1 Tax=Paeniglutamicibacter sp. NPDC012692 TaxID=3364388 RepID=UPI0036BCD845